LCQTAALAVFAFAGTALSLPQAARAQPQESLRLSVMSFNLRYGTANDGANSWKYRRGLVFDVIREESPDVLGTQEALRFQLDELGAAFPEYTEIGVGRDDGKSNGEYSAILYRESRFELVEQGTFWFSDTPGAAGSMGWGANLPRICTWARLVERGSRRAFYVYNLHFDHQSQESRERSAELLAQRILERGHPDPVIVTGDFNADEDNAAIRYLTGEVEPAPRLRDSFRVLYPDATDVGTFNGFAGTSTRGKIDHVLVSAAWEVESAAIVRFAREGRYPSDHFPVTATLRLVAP
jgi:endonuclease/exonuclease/phosphatase family metal-dependent hydrolase